jgi:type I restriction-modification system DNA methylase subunit
LELHRLAWNFCYAPLLITFEQGLVRAWNCCEKPPDDFLFPPDNLKLAEHQVGKGKASLAEQAAHTLHWVNLITGDFLRRKEADGCLKVERRADRMLLDNLKFIRNRLIEMKLPPDTCHDLLARIIFVQFLCERKDSTGNAALGATQFKALHAKRKLSQSYQDFKEILTNKEDAYALFRYLNSHFNGDLFPGKSLPRSQREAAWKKEMNEVQPKHLTELVKLLDGRLQAENSQLCLWRHYSFDTIPLEFISSVYEEFVTKRREAEQENATPKPAKKKDGVVYTPGHLVDFVLDRVLPWGDKNWNLKILDPAAGTGIFLVKAFQRLMHRWRLANEGKPMTPKIPRRLLEKNLFGVDIDPEAIRVASFSLYLAMLDELDPKLYFQRTKFPNLYRRRLIDSDFFENGHNGFKTNPSERGKYDLVIGNAPWGEDIVKDAAAAWAKENKWTVADKNIGPLFLAKALTLTKKNGRVAMLQPAGALLANSNYAEFRNRLFQEIKVESVYNFSPIRWVLFEKAVSPCALIVLQQDAPDDSPFFYCSPKPQHGLADKYSIAIEPHDGHWVFQHEVLNNIEIWPALIWGGRRDLALIKSMSSHPSLADHEKSGLVVKREGIIRGKIKYNDIEDRRILEADDFPPRTFLRLNLEQLPENKNVYVHRRTKLDAFITPQLILKASWTKENGRFRAVVVDAPDNQNGAICSQSYVSISGRGLTREQFEAAALMFNSQLTTFLLLLTSRRFAFYRPEPLVEDMMMLPLLAAQPRLLEGLENNFEEIDNRVRRLFQLEDAEWALVEDLCGFTLPDYQGDGSTFGYRPTSRKLNKEVSRARPGMAEYCRYFMDVLRAGFGEDKKICATVFHEANKEHLPIRLVAIHLDSPGQEGVRAESLSNEALCQQLQDLADTARANGRNAGANYQRRTLRVYSVVKMDGRKVQTVFLVKPDQRRFWTRSIALRDADAVAADIMTWRNAAAETESRSA